MKFIIFSLPRSGTSFLTTSLRSHPEILCHGEALLPRHFDRHVHGSARNKLSAELCEQDPVTFVQDLFECRDGHSAVGFKVFPGHSPDAHEVLLRDETVSKIILKRENHLASFSSRVIAKETGQWDLKNTAHQKDAKVEFNPKAFDRHVQNADAFFAKVKDMCQGPNLSITYEDHIMGQRLRPILEFLTTDSNVETHSNKAKQLGRSIVDRFANPEAVTAHLDKIDHPEWAYE